jgi:hypothetical protein
MSLEDELLRRGRINVHRTFYLPVAIAFGVAITLVLLACHAGVGYMMTGQPCHAGGGCPVTQVCVDGFCAVPETYLFGHADSGRPSGYPATVGDGGDD